MEQKTNPEPQIDAVALVRRIRDAQHTELEGKTWEERAAYYRRQAEALHSTVRRRRQADADAPR